MPNRPLSISVVFIFIVLNALVWLAFGVIVATGIHPAFPDQPLVKGIMAFLSLAAAGVLLTLFFRLAKRNRIAYYLTLAFFVVASVLIVLDDVGWVDLVVLTINIIPIILLYKDRGWCLRPKSPLN
ncbi:MAG: hypothetical protein U9Q82_07145 [Chloroflexota bacterium]|nr:hypothetical protein [Chloroflexota bacterium]